tara:strand:- start:137 stop:799 length:663 start_codon:yes stop_codon:yes gene_type:complete
MIDLWFPTAIYHEDLDPSENIQKHMLEYFERIYAKNLPVLQENYSYTGDAHGDYKLFNDSRFSWLNMQVAFHCEQYLSKFNVDVDKIKLYASKAWPVIVEKGGKVNKHNHRNSCLSAVYYLKTGNVMNGGYLKFHSPNPNRLPIHVETLNDLSYSHATYAPMESRLMIFPSSLEHEVEPYLGSIARYSISYDIMVTRSDDAGHNEFAIVDPCSWKEIDAI